MARTLGDLKDWALLHLHEDTADPSFTATLVPEWARQGVDKVLTHTYWNWNTGVRSLTWPASAGEFSTLYLPEYIDQILSAYPGTDEGIGSIDIINAWELDQYRPGVGTQLGKDYLVLWGWYWVEADNPTAAVLTMVSSAGAAGNGVQVWIEGRDANGREIRETVTLAGAGTGTTTATFAAGTDGVRRIALIGGTAATTGVVTVSNGATDLAVLDSVWEKYQEHQRTELYTSSTTTTYTVRYFRRHRRLEADADYLPIPERFEDLIELWIAAKVGQFRGNMDEHVSQLSEYKQRLREMIAWDRRQPGKKRQLHIRRQWGYRRRGGFPR